MNVPVLACVAMIGLAACVTSRAARAGSPSLELERLAIRAALGRTSLTVASDPVLVINPDFVAEGSAPGTVSVAVRDAASSRELARLLGAKIERRNDVMTCRERRCTLAGADVYVSISEPRVQDADACVTVTLETGRPRYETLHFIFTLDGGRWRLVRSTQLGIT